MPATIKQLTLLTLLLGLVLPPPLARQVEEPLPFETVVKYFTNGPRKDMQTIVTNKHDWKKIWKKAHRGYFPSAPPRPQVDFSQRMIVVVAFEYLPDPSFSMAISKIIRTEDALRMLRIIVKQTAHTGSFCPPTHDIVVFPLHIVEVERVEKRLIKNA
ncbi:MAG TPA: hypothetical protein VJH03_10195 [Blastocatellia bacterium]|nr:hypothetical protein [Blastocatellia bacterium]